MDSRYGMNFDAPDAATRSVGPRPAFRGGAQRPSAEDFYQVPAQPEKPAPAARTAAPRAASSAPLSNCAAIPEAALHEQAMAERMQAALSAQFSDPLAAFAPVPSSRVSIAEQLGAVPAPAGRVSGPRQPAFAAPRSSAHANPAAMRPAAQVAPVAPEPAPPSSMEQAESLLGRMNLGWPDWLQVDPSVRAMKLRECGCGANQIPGSLDAMNRFAVMRSLQRAPSIMVAPSGQVAADVNRQGASASVTVPWWLIGVGAVGIYLYMNRKR